MATDLTAAYAARLDAHLPTLADDRARRAFLTSQLQRFENDYIAFQGKAARDEPLPPNVRAADFTLTIAEIGRRLGAYAEVAHA